MTELTIATRSDQGAAGTQEWPVTDANVTLQLIEAVDHLANLVTRLSETLDISGTVDARDSGEREYTPVIGTAMSVGPTVIHTPAPGKRVRLRWITAINDPTAENATRISVYLGDKPVYNNWVISKRQFVTGPIDGQLIVDLSVAGNVAVNAMIEEI